MNLNAQIKLNRYATRRSYKGNANPAYKHGMYGTPIYKIWGGLLSRCYNPKVKIYKYYGGRGIKVCDSWQEFINFYKDMGDRPVGLQLDRINNDGDYSPENCKWVTPKENNPANKETLKDEMPGKKFGKWFVIKRVKQKPGHWYYLCICDCGFNSIKCGSDLRLGKSTKCINCKNIAHRGWSERRSK